MARSTPSLSKEGQACLSVFSSPASAPSAVARTGDWLGELCRKSQAGDPRAEWDYHELVFRLTHSQDMSTYYTRHWLASYAFEIENSLIDRVKPTSPYGKAEFEVEMRRRAKDMTRLAHPVFSVFLNQPLSPRDRDLFIQHHWYRARHFWRLVAELGVRMPPPVSAPIFENLYDEFGGSGGSTKFHPGLLKKLVEHLRINADYYDVPNWIEALKYLNNRSRSMMSGETAWGLAVFYSIEGTASNFAAILEALKRHGIPDELCEFYHLHAEVDGHHEQRLVGLITDSISTADDQATFFTSLQRHKDLGFAYLSRLWDESEVRLKNAG